MIKKRYACNGCGKGIERKVPFCSNSCKKSAWRRWMKNVRKAVATAGCK